MVIVIAMNRCITYSSLLYLPLVTVWIGGSWTICQNGHSNRELNGTRLYWSNIANHKLIYIVIQYYSNKIVTCPCLLNGFYTTTSQTLKFLITNISHQTQRVNFSTSNKPKDQLMWNTFGGSLEIRWAIVAVPILSQPLTAALGNFRGSDAPLAFVSILSYRKRQSAACGKRLRSTGDTASNNQFAIIKTRHIHYFTNHWLH